MATSKRTTRRTAHAKRCWERRYATATIIGYTDRKIGFVKVTGLVTGSTWGQLLSDLGEWCATHAHSGLVAHYEGAAFVMDAERMTHFDVHACRLSPSLELPICAVTTIEQTELFWTYALGMGKAGFLRCIEHDRRDAMDWTCRNALVYEYFLAAEGKATAVDQHARSRELTNWQHPGVPARSMTTGSDA